MREGLHIRPEPQEHPRIALIKELRAALQEYIEHPPVAPPGLVKEICEEMRIVIGLQEHIAMTADMNVRDTLRDECERRMQTLHRLNDRLLRWQNDPFNG